MGGAAKMGSLADLCDGVMAKLSEEKKTLADREATLKRSRDQLEAEKTAMTAAGISEDDLLHLNVGGEIFAVKRSTLLIGPEDSYLKAMFSGRWDESVIRDPEGRIVLNMTPKVFSTILSYLRTVQLFPERKKLKLSTEKEYQEELA